MLDTSFVKPVQPACALPSRIGKKGMGKIIHCGELFPGCHYVARGHDDVATLICIVEHLTAEHDVRDIGDDLLHRARAVMRDVASGGANR